MHILFLEASPKPPVVQQPPTKSTVYLARFVTQKPASLDYKMIRHNMKPTPTQSESRPSQFFFSRCWRLRDFFIITQGRRDPRHNKLPPMIAHNGIPNKEETSVLDFRRRRKWMEHVCGLLIPAAGLTIMCAVPIGNERCGCFLPESNTSHCYFFRWTKGKQPWQQAYHNHLRQIIGFFRR